MTELQNKEHELLKVFIHICATLNIQYFLVCGSALGAVKYQGFIPWDDDIDVALLRPDYEKFLSEAPALLPQHLFLQNYKSDPAFPAIFSKLRNSNTTYIEKSASNLPIHHGIYIDIFPLDGYPVTKRAQRYLEIRKAVYKRLLSAAYRPNRRWKWIFIAPFRILGVHRHTAMIAKRYEHMVAQYSTDDSPILTNHGNWQGKLDYCSRELFGDGCLLCFEGMKVRVPKDYDSYLRKKYGDYEKDPPKSDQVGHHFYVTLDCNRSYKEYLK